MIAAPAPTRTFHNGNPADCYGIRTRSPGGQKNAPKNVERTKSQISRKRQPGTRKASAATRRCRDLEERLGESEKTCNDTRAEKATGKKCQPCPAATVVQGKRYASRDVPDERYGSVKSSWPAEAWLVAYGPT